MNEARLLKLSEVAARLSISRSTIYRLMARGELPVVRVGGILRFPATEIDRLINGTKGDPTQTAAAED